MVQVEAKRILEIQRTYFSLLKDCFREQYAEVSEASGNPEVGIRKWIGSRTEGQIIYTVKRRLEDLQNFWKQYYDELCRSLTSLDLLPIYSVSRPLYLKRQITSAGLYVDTIVCHDDTLSGLRNFDLLPPMKRLTLAANLLRDYMDLLLLERCFISNLDPPFVILCPGERDFDFNIEKKIIERSLELITAYANDLLDARYSSWEDVSENTQKIVGAGAIKKVIKRANILPAPFREPKNDADRLSQCFERMRILQEQSQPIKPKQPNLKDLLVSFITEFGVMEGQLHGSIELDLAPLFPRYTWALYKWRVENGNLDNSKVLGWEERQTSAITTAIQHENLDWLSNIPLDAIMELRNEGFLEDFRQKIRLARKRMTLEEGADFTRVAQSVEREIESAIAEHAASIKSLEREAHRRLKTETGKFLGKVSLGIASFWFPPISIMSLVGDAGKYAREIINNKKLLKSIPDRLRRGPWGLLMESKPKKSNQ